MAARLLELRATFPAGGWMSVVNAAYCQVYISAVGRSPVQRSPAGCGVSECDREAGQRGGPGPLGAVAPWKNNYCPGKTVTINRVLFVDYFKQ